MSREQFKARHFSAEGMQVVDDSHYAGLEMAKPGQVQQWHQGLQVVPQGGYHSDARTPTQWHDAPPVAPQGYYQGDVRKSPAENEGLQFAPAYPSTPSPMIAMPAIPMVAMPTEKPWEREPGGYQTPRQGTPASKSENGYTGFPEKQNMYGAATAELGVKTSIEYTAPPEGVKKKRICGLKKSWFFYIGLIVLVIVIIAVIVGVVTVTRKKSTSDSNEDAASGIASGSSSNLSSTPVSTSGSPQGSSTQNSASQTPKATSSPSSSKSNTDSSTTAAAASTTPTIKSTSTKATKTSSTVDAPSTVNTAFPSTGTIDVDCPAVDGTQERVQVGEMGVIYLLHCNVDYIGNDLQITNATTVDDCLQGCAELDGCKGAVFNGDLAYTVINGGNCFLKSDTSDGSSTGDSGQVIGAVLYGAVL